MKIKYVHAAEILDSRGNPTIETEVILEDGSFGIAAIASGTLTSNFETSELRDGDPNRFNGMGVLKAVSNVNNMISPKIIGMESSSQSTLDQELLKLDSSPNNVKLGGNSLLSVSEAVLKAAAMSYKLPVYIYLQKKYQLIKPPIILPTPIFNIINGGKHGAGNLDFQEFHIIPIRRKSYHESLQCGEEIYQILKKVLIYRHAIHSIGDEGGFAPNLFTNLDALEIIKEAISQTNYQLTKDIFLGLDVAANFFYRNNQYTIKDKAQPYNKDEFIEYLLNLNQEYHLISLEDPINNEDWKGWAALTAKIGKGTMIIGDDLLCTNKIKIRKAILEKSCNAVLIKPNQVATITQVIEVIQIARKANWKIIVSHRSGETNDDFIADLAVASGADYIKFGAPARGERIAKYNRLLKIETEITK